VPRRHQDGCGSIPNEKRAESCRVFVQNLIVQMAPRVEGRSLPPVLGVTSRLSQPIPVPWLHRPRALAPLRLAEIALTGIRPPAAIAIKDFAEFVEHFRSDPGTPTGKSFACGSDRAFFFPPSTHRGNFEQVRTFILRFRHGLECHRRLLKTRCLFASKHPQFHYFPDWSAKLMRAGCSEYFNGHTTSRTWSYHFFRSPFPSALSMDERPVRPGVRRFGRHEHSVGRRSFAVANR